MNRSNSYFVTNPGSAKVFNSLSEVNSNENYSLYNALSFYPSEPRAFTSLIFQEFEETITKENVSNLYFLLSPRTFRMVNSLARDCLLLSPESYRLDRWKFNELFNSKYKYSFSLLKWPGFNISI